jgi:hypothetical protein
MRAIFQGKVLELVEREYNEKTYRTLICYEEPQIYRREITEINVMPEQTDAAKALVGKTALVEVDQRKFNNRLSNTFVKGSVKQ